MTSYKKPELTVEIKALIVKLKNDGKLQKENAEIIGCAESTVYYTLKNSQNGSPTIKKALCGRKRLLNENEIEKVVEIVENKRLISGPKLSVKVEEELSKKISSKTLKRYIKNDGFKALHLEGFL